MADWIDQNTFISDDGKVVRNGLYRDQDGAVRTYFGPKPINQPPSWSQPGSQFQGQDNMFVGSPAARTAPRSYQAQQLVSPPQERGTTFVQGPAAKPAPQSNRRQSPDEFYEDSTLTVQGFLLVVVPCSIFFGFLALLMMGR